MEKGVGGGDNLNTTSPSGHSSLLKEEKFWEIVKAGFAHKRKKLSKNLADAGVQYKKTELGNKRAEELELKDWITLAQKT